MIRAIAVVICLPLGWLFPTQMDLQKAVQGRGQNSFLKQPTEGLGLRDARSIDAFRQTLAAVGVPGGIVLFGQHSTEPRFDFFLPSGMTLREALNSVAAIDPRYKWEMDNEAVNILPAVGRATILDLRTKAFSSGDAVDVNLALGRLLRLSEVKARISELGLDQAPREFGPTSVPKPGSASIPPRRPLSVRCQNVTLREALNSIARADGKAIWIYEELQQQGKPVFRIYFGVR